MFAWTIGVRIAPCLVLFDSLPCICPRLFPIDGRWHVRWLICWYMLVPRVWHMLLTYSRAAFSAWSLSSPSCVMISSSIMSMSSCMSSSDGGACGVLWRGRGTSQCGMSLFSGTALPVRAWFCSCGSGGHWVLVPFGLVKVGRCVVKLSSVAPSIFAGHPFLASLLIWGDVLAVGYLCPCLWLGPWCWFGIDAHRWSNCRYGRDYI